MPRRNPCRLYIHLASTYSLRWSLKRTNLVWRKRTWTTGSSAFFHQRECVKCVIHGPGLSVLSVKRPLMMWFGSFNFSSSLIGESVVIVGRPPLVAMHGDDGRARGGRRGFKNRRFRSRHVGVPGGPSAVGSYLPAWQPDNKLGGGIMDSRNHQVIFTHGVDLTRSFRILSQQVTEWV